MKKIRVDLTAHTSIVVGVNECDDMYDKAAEIAESFIQGNPSFDAYWEVDDGGVDDADENDEVSVYENEID